MLKKMSLNKYFFIFLIGLLAINIFGLLVPETCSMFVEQFFNAVKCFGCLMGVFLWGTVYDKYEAVIVAPMAFFNGMVSLLAVGHAYNVDIFHTDRSFLYNTLYHYAVILFVFGQYYLTRRARGQAK